MAKGVGRGDVIFTSPFTFVATAEAIALVGAIPVFVDVDPATFNIDPAALERAIKSLKETGSQPYPLPQNVHGNAAAIKGIIAVDLFGVPADFAAINSIAADEGLFVIEDAAQSFGARSGNRRAGALAEIGCTSFFPAKPLGAYGDGGALFTNDPELDALFRSIRVHGQGSDRYENVRLGVTGRLDTVQAAVLLAKLEIFEDELMRRQHIADTYTRLIEDSKLELAVPSTPSGLSSAWAQYSVVAKDGLARDRFRAALDVAGVPSAIYYPKPLHLQAVFLDLGYLEGDFPVSEYLAARIFSLPMHPYLTDDEIVHVVKCLKEANS
jgi:dTDP-4-amino-4,6-dideoxygalactose transaminase